MHPRQAWQVLAAFLAISILYAWVDTSSANAQSEDPFFRADQHGLRRGPGGYFAWYKLVLITVVFSSWIAVADYANREALRLADYLQTKAEVWNPIFVISFLVGLFCVFSIPWFWAGLPVFALTCFLPPTLFFVARNKQVEATLSKTVSATGKIAGPLQLVKVQEEKRPLEIIPHGQGQVPQQLLFQAKQVPAFNDLRAMLQDALRRNADIAATVVTREKTMVQMQIDGLWHPVGEMDPVSGQGVIAAAQIIAGCDPSITSRPQDGGFRLKRDREKRVIRFSSQPSQNDYRGIFRIESGDDVVMTLAELGMNDKQAAIVRIGLGGDGMYVVSSTPSQGVTTLWKAALQAADRWTRDWFSVVSESDTETVMENIGRQTFPVGDTQAAIEIVRKYSLKQAGGFIVPELFDPKLTDALLAESKSDGRKTVTRFTAKSASEAILRAYAAAGDRKEMAAAIKGAVYQRLVRKLCPTCREKKAASADLIQKLGGNPKDQDFLYGTRQIPVELPKEYVPCPKCNDIGYVGRTGIFEIIEMNDTIRKVLMTQPKIDAIAQAARKTGSPSLLNAGFHLVLNGITTLEELKRACG